MTKPATEPPDHDDAVVWPPLPDLQPDDPQADVKKVLYEAQVQDALRRQQWTVETSKAARAHDYTQREALHLARIELIKSAIERAQSRAQYIQTASAAISTAYVAILAVSFRADGNSQGSHLVSAQAIVPTIFLGLSIGLSAIYLSYIGLGAPVPGPEPGASPEENQERRLETFTKWSAAMVMTRVYFLRAAVVSLAVGVILMPFAFVKPTSHYVAFIISGALLLVLVLPALIRGDRSD